MEALKRKRTQFRKKFTKAADALEKAFSEHKDTERDSDLESRFCRLSDCAEELFVCENSIRDLWCQSDNFEEKEFEEDQDLAEVYEIRWSKLKIDYKKYNERKNDCDHDECSVS
ncbi:hypothetical protein ACJJTC_014836, partial [Scirpophaga incertulas]